VLVGKSSLGTSWSGYPEGKPWICTEILRLSCPSTIVS